MEGITRNTVITLARDLGYEIVQRSISRTELYIADEIFLTGTAAEIVGVISVDGKEISKGKEGEITRSIRDLYQKIVSASSQNEKYRQWVTPVW